MAADDESADEDGVQQWWDDASEVASETFFGLSTFFGLITYQDRIAERGKEHWLVQYLANRSGIISPST
jgi:hypothetical protein